MQKIRYEIDPHNRLIINQTGRKTSFPQFRKVLDGKFKVGKDNALAYHVKAPTPHEVKTPHQVRLKGRWALTKNHNLRLTLDKWKRQTFGDKLTLDGDIIDVNKNSIKFSITTKSKEKIKSVYMITLRGFWHTDRRNRLTFKVRKERGKYDILTFSGIWRINKFNQIVYQYEKARLIRKRSKVHTLTLRGHWDIGNRLRLSYVIDRNTNSVLHFKTSAGIFKDNYIKYEIGIRLSHRARPVKRIVTLFGRWKIKRNTGLTFEVKYGSGKIKPIVFGVKLSHKILKTEGEAFLRFLKSRHESRILAGLGRKW